MVRFILAKNPSTGKDIGKSLCLVSETGRPEFTLAERDKRRVGTLVKKPSDLPLPENFGDGLVQFKVETMETEGAGEGKKEEKEEKEEGGEASAGPATMATAILARRQLNEGHVHIDVNDVVTFDLYRSDKAGLCMAKEVTLRRKPHEKFDATKRELGVISALKNNFGFVTCTERLADVFLHASQFQDDVPKEEIVIGRDVTFSVIRAEENGRLQVCVLSLFSHPLSHTHTLSLSLFR